MALQNWRTATGSVTGISIPGIFWDPSDNAVVVDWLDASRGNPASDVCRSYVLMKRHAAPELASAYLDLYAAVGDIAHGEVLAWLPFVAAARLAEGVPQEVDGLMQMIDTI